MSTAKLIRAFNNAQLRAARSITSRSLGSTRSASCVGGGYSAAGTRSLRLETSAVCAMIASAALIGGTVAYNASGSEHSRLDDMWDSPERFTRLDVYAYAQKLFEKDPEDTEVMWRLARAAHDLSEEMPTDAAGKKRKKELLDEAMRLIRDAKAKNRSNGNIFRWSGIILSAAGQFQGTSEYIKNAFVIRDEWEQAIYINPSDASALHLLGRWHFDVANMSWVTRKVAATFFAEPPTATFQEAREYFLRSESTAPGFWKANQLMLAETEYQLGNKAEAARWAKSALAIPVRTKDDKDAHAKAEKLLGTVDAAALAEWKKAVQAKSEHFLKEAEARAKQL